MITAITVNNTGGWKYTVIVNGIHLFLEYNHIKELNPRKKRFASKKNLAYVFFLAFGRDGSFGAIVNAENILFI